MFGRGLMVLLVLAGCASTQPADYVEVCNQETIEFMARNPSRLDPEGAFRVWHQVCTDRHTREGRRQLGVAIGVVLSAGADAALMTNVQRGFDGRFRHRH